MNKKGKKFYRFFGFIFFYLAYLLSPSSCFAEDNSKSKSSSISSVVVKSEKPLEMEVYDSHNLVGEVNYTESVKFYSKVSGKITSITKAEGDQVKCGDIIVTINKPIADANLESASSSYQKAQSSYERTLSMHRKKFISDEDLEKNKNAMFVAKSQYEDAKNKYDDMVIKAPFDGLIGAVPYIKGNNVNLGDFLFSIVNSGSSIEINFFVSEKLVKNVTENSKILAVLPDKSKIECKITAISRYLNESGNSIVKTIAINNPMLIQGSFVDAELQINKHNALCIKEEGILNSDQGKYVFINNDNVAKKVFVTTGTRFKEYIEIISDSIDKDTMVISSGINKVEDGTNIKEEE